MNRKIEGYWWSEQTPEYPKPTINVLTKPQASFYCSLIQTIQNDRRACRELICKGMSFSRITGETLGCKEYVTSEYRWPCDFPTHYVKEHRVRPSDDFIMFLRKYVRDMKDKNLQKYFLEMFELYQLEKIKPIIPEPSGMNEWDDYIDSCYKLVKIGKSMREAINEVANCNNIDKRLLATEMNRRSQITKRAKRAREEYKSTVKS